MAKAEPKSIAEIRDRMFQRLWRWLKRANLFARTVVLIVLALALVFVARLGLFGETSRKIAEFVLPVRLPVFDAARARPSLILTFQALRDGIQSDGRNGAIYRTDDTIVLHVMPSADAWTLIFGLDKRGEHPVIGQQFRPVLLQGDEKHDVRFRLDKTIGQEAYFAIAAAEPFTFERDIRPKLGEGKGPLMQELPLDDRFVQQAIWFIHVAR